MRIPSKKEMALEKKKKSLQKRMEKKRDEAEEAEERKLQEKLNRRTGKDKFNSNGSLHRASVEILKQAMKKWQISVKGNNVFNAILKAELGKKFSRKKRADKYKFLAVGCAVYHELANQPNPKEAVHQLAESVGVNIDRISDPCRIIVECLVDYGVSKRERLANRQYAATDARALSYVVREGYDPHEVMKPPKGESVTVWADRESEYRSGLRPANKRAKKGPKPHVSIEPLPGQLAVVELTQAVRKALEAIAGHGVLVLKPKDGGELLALAIAPLDGLTAEKAIKKPGKVREAIKKALIKSRHKTNPSPNNSDW